MALQDLTNLPVLEVILQMKYALGKIVHLVKATFVSKSSWVFPKCGTTAILVSEAGSTFFWLSQMELSYAMPKTTWVSGTNYQQIFHWQKQSWGRSCCSPTSIADRYKSGTKASCSLVLCTWHGPACSCCNSCPRAPLFPRCGCTACPVLSFSSEDVIK